MMLRGLYLAILISLANCDTYEYVLDTVNGSSFEVSENFLSIALDTSNLSTIDLSQNNLTKLVKHLSPMYLRIGGTAADTVLFEDDSVVDNSTTADYVMNASYWLKIHEFAKNANVSVIYDLNSLLRNSNGSWNSENAEQMIKFSSENGLTLDWELGNEPDLYHAIYNKYVDANQLGEDYKTLRSIMDKYQYNSSYLVGPSMFDVGSNSDTQNYLKNFLSVASGTIGAVTWHHYYFNGHDGTSEMFLNPETFNSFEQKTKAVTDIVGSQNKVWLGETSSAYQGGAPGMSDRFLASFIWLDKLGLGAKLGLDVIVRQSIWLNNYSLLDADYNPNPDWWVSLLYKKLVGTKVIPLTTNTSDINRPVRLYAHCATPFHANYDWGYSAAVVLFGVNLSNTTQSFQINEFYGDFDNDIVRRYSFTSKDLLSKNVYLNGIPLALTDDLELPELYSFNMFANDVYWMDPYSIVFWVFQNTTVAACK